MVWGTANTPYEKNAMWDKIKEIGGDNPSDIIADIKVEDNDLKTFFKAYKESYETGKLSNLITKRNRYENAKNSSLSDKLLHALPLILLELCPP